MEVVFLSNCPFAEIEMTFANFCLKCRFLLQISLTRDKNRREFPLPRLASETRRRTTTKYGIPGNIQPIFGGKKNS